MSDSPEFLTLREALEVLIATWREAAASNEFLGRHRREPCGC